MICLMKKQPGIFFLTLLLASITVPLVHASPAGCLAVEHLRCEYRDNPVGMDVVQPRLSWTLASAHRGQRQTAFRILAASHPEKLMQGEGDLWDSGKVGSDQTMHVVYSGKPLLSRIQVWWKVRAWDNADQPSDWSACSSWTMGLLNPSDWKAKWIADPESTTNTTARGPLNGYHSEIATAAATSKWVSVDLGKERLFDAVHLFPAHPYDWQPNTPGFLFPVRFKIEVAARADFSDARLLLDRSAVDEPNPGTNSLLYRFPDTAARFLRLTATQLRRRDGNNFAFALAEMQILNGVTNIAHGAKPSALDSIETGPWALNNLVDGITVTVPPDGTRNQGALPATMVRKCFDLSAPVRHAAAYVSAQGLYEFHLNGERVGNQLLAPEWTSLPEAHSIPGFRRHPSLATW